ncbi:Protein of unknown function DUF2283 [Methanocaldococcus sp. FS406-22]|uniref:DUF2283 domain-containing protein n=1 Tax=Methanocaldococcus sp. (strain FS406-22) TaxID=644281 RepID=UPI0001BF47F6|nr:DUF2283 domain-containing protein [Methanocaldococcus sp. FS406-22]ADC70061.1 Protein of unknown function DUF2283 [Methanocaldococcus sp. FS406-22]
MKVKIDYDYENDSLLVYKDGRKSKKTLDLDDILIDFDENGDVVGIEMLNASKLFNVDKFDLLKNLVKFEAIGKITKDLITLELKLWILRKKKEIVKESTVKGLNTIGIKEGEVVMG